MRNANTAWCVCVCVCVCVVYSARGMQTPTPKAAQRRTVSVCTAICFLQRFYYSVFTTWSSLCLKSHDSVVLIRRSCSFGCSYLCVCVCVCARARIHLPVYRSIDRSIYLSIYPSIYPSIYLSINPSIYPAALGAHTCVCVCVCARARVSMYLPMQLGFGCSYLPESVYCVRACGWVRTCVMRVCICISIYLSTYLSVYPYPEMVAWYIPITTCVHLSIYPSIYPDTNMSYLYIRIYPSYICKYIRTPRWWRGTYQSPRRFPAGAAPPLATRAPYGPNKQDTKRHTFKH